MRELVVTSRDAPKLLEAIEEAFDEIAGAILLTIKGARVAPIGTRWDDGLSGRRFDLSDQRVRVVTLIANDGLDGKVCDQLWCAVDIGGLPGGQNHAQRVAQRIDRDVKFGAQSSARPPKRLWPGFF